MNDNKNKVEQLLNGIWKSDDEESKMFIIEMPRLDTPAKRHSTFEIEWFEPAETWRIISNSDYFRGYSCFLMDINENNFTLAAYKSGNEDTIVTDSITKRISNADKIFKFKRFPDGV